MTKWKQFASLILAMLMVVSVLPVSAIAEEAEEEPAAIVETAEPEEAIVPEAAETVEAEPEATEAAEDTVAEDEAEAIPGAAAPTPPTSITPSDYLSAWCTVSSFCGVAQPISAMGIPVWNMPWEGASSATKTTRTDATFNLSQKIVNHQSTDWFKTSGGYIRASDVIVTSTSHSFKYTITLAPTTTTAGSIHGACEHCGVVSNVAMPKLNTDDYDYHLTVQPTCTSTGKAVYVWKNTSYVTNAAFTVNVAVLPHAYTYTMTKVPTSATTGLLTGFCPDCEGFTTVTMPKVSAADYVGSASKEPTCTEKGTGFYTWKNTTYGAFSFNTELAATGHDIQETVVAPTCVTKGYTLRTCMTCGFSEKVLEVAMVPHSYSFRIISEPTASEVGELAASCSVCKEVVSVELPVLSATDYTISPNKAATCIAEGKKGYTWKDTTYGTVYFEIILEMIDHNYAASMIVAPTCKEMGYTKYVCSGCTDSYVADYVDPIPHTFPLSLITVAQDPTTSAPGKLNRKCSACGQDDVIELPKLDKVNYTFSSASGVATYTWKTTTYGTWVFEDHSLQILEQPSSFNVPPVGNVTFHVEAVGDGLTYQWQFRTPTGNWTKSPAAGSTTDTLVVPATVGRKGYQYRCIVKDSHGDSRISATGLLRIITSKIVTQPASVTVDAGQPATFAVAATGTGLTYQWQCKTPDGTWANTNITGYNTNTIQLTATAAEKNNQYRCIVTDADGNELISNAALLNVIAFTIDMQPASLVMFKGSTAFFNVLATGENLTYKWQYRTTPTGGWMTTSATGAKTPALQVPATTGRNGYQYRCVVSDQEGNTRASDPATLTVVFFSVVEMPKDQFVVVGKKAEFSVKLSGTGMTYKWQYRTSPTGSWMSTSATGYNTDTLVVSGTLSRNGYQYRCVVTDANGLKVNFGPATLSINNFRIQTQPVDVIIAAKQNAVFSVDAIGDGLTYQWQFRTPTGSWTKSPAIGNTTNTLTIPATAGRNGYTYRCIITDAYGNKLTSNAAMLTVY